MADTLSHAFFYNSEDGDRIYDADSFEYLLKKFFTSGVFSGSCQVIADGAGMTCQMQAGYSNCDGKVRFFSEAVNLAIANAHATYDRIDTVVIERNDTDRDITCKVVTGTYSANPVAPAPVRSGGIYQLVVAEVYVAGGAVRITQSAITDKRPDTSVCGYVMCAVDTPDFSELYAQFTAQADEYIQVETADFEAWYQRMKDQLSEDAAGHLQEQIDDQQDQITALHAVATETTDGLMSANDKTNLEAISDIVDETIAIVANGNVAPKAISAGQYVIWNKALYTARSAIAAGATLSTSNLAAVPNGGFNNLKSSIDSLNSNIETLNNRFVYIYGSGGYTSEASKSAIKAKVDSLSVGSYFGSISSGDYGLLLIIKGSDNYASVVRFSYANTTSAVAVRSMTKYNGEWGDWINVIS